MKQRIIIVLLSLLSTNMALNAQVSLTATSGTTAGSYSTLGAAFAKINDGTHQGAITINLTASTTEGSTATLNASGSGGAVYTLVNIHPDVSGVTISGNLNGSPLIGLNGADYVTIDGRVGAAGSSVDLTISNTSTGAGSTCTFRFDNDATYNTLQYCKIQGSSSNTGSGILLFGTTAVSAGNSHNTIDNNNITNAGGNRPNNVVYSRGSITASSKYNTISNNNIYDFLGSSNSNSCGILLGESPISDGYNSDWTIIGNSFYETTSYAPANSCEYRIISIDSRIGSTHGDNFTVSNNYIGGSGPGCTGTFILNSSIYNHPFWGIQLHVSSTNATTIQGNVIKNIKYYNGGGVDWWGIYVDYGAVNIGTVSPNYIGSASDTGSIFYSCAGNGGRFLAYHLQGDATDFQNNVVGSITVANQSSANSTSFWGIHAQPRSNTNIISNNTIGSTTVANSIKATSPSTSNAQTVIGYYNQDDQPVTLSNNTIANLTNGTTNTIITTQGKIYGVWCPAGRFTMTGNSIHDLTIANANNSTGPVRGNPDNTSLSAGGIVLASQSGYSNTVTGNTVYNISNTYSSFGGHVAGIYYYCNTIASTVSGNLVYGLTVSPGSSDATISGIKIVDGSATYSNNIVTLGGNTTTRLYGIYEAGTSGSTSYIYFNTVYLNGSPSSGSLNSACLYNAGNANTRNFRNNILNNARSGNGTHYGIYFVYTGGTLTCDFNDYYVTGSGSTPGYYGVAKSSLPIVTGVTGNDAGSKSALPIFANPGGTAATDYLPSELSLAGACNTGITTSYTGATRFYNSMGAFEYIITPIVAVTASLGTTFSCYTTIKEAFDAINAGTHKGAITIKLSGNTVESASAVLYNSGYQSNSSYTSINIYPATAGLSISGNVDWYPLIDLNGANNVTIDGRVDATGVTVGLVISNTSTSAGSSTSTIRFINDATNNTIQYCKIQGSATYAYSGVLFFSACNSATGNSSNTIDHNEITCAADASRPLNAMYSQGSSNTNANISNSISNNSFYNFLSLGTASNGIYLSGSTSGWTISGNSFYETASFVPTATVAYNIIYINNTSGTNFTVSNNYIGGSGPGCSGTWTKTNAFDNTFYSIYISAGTGTASNVRGNTITNFAYSNPLSASWYGIYQNAGNVNIGTPSGSGNTIGQSTGTASITFTGGATGAALYGIYVNSTGISDIENNIVGSVTVSNSSANATNFYGIYKAAAAGTTTIINNTVGSTATSNSINASSASSSNTQSVTGIYSAGTGTVTISNNTLANLTNGTTNTSTVTPGQINGINITSGTNTVSANSVHDLTIANANTATNTTLDAAGIIISTGTAAAQTISGNEAYNISNSYSSFGGSVAGLYYYGPNTASIVDKNHIYGLSVSSGSTSSTLYGIRIVAGITTYSNNIITLDGNTSATLYGIYEAGSSGANIYFNTVYLGGSPASGSLNSACLYNAGTSSARNFRNNIFNNARSSASGKHYALYILTAGGTLTCDYNDYYVSGTGGTPGYYGGDKMSLPVVTGATGNDVHSLATMPGFAIPGGTNAADYIPFVILAGTSITGITTDYANRARAATPSMGAHEISVLICADPTSGGSIAAGQTICSGFAPAAFNSTALPAGHTGTLEYQWQSSTTSASGGFSGITPSDAAAYAPGTLIATTWFKRLARVNCSPNWLGCVTSNVIEVTVNQPIPFTPPTVANLNATGQNIQWYAADAGGVPLATTATLVNGTHYYASQTVDNCESSQRLDVTAHVDPTPCAPAGSAAQTFGAGATISNLAATGNLIRWYLAPTGGAALAPTLLLTTATDYYATKTINCIQSAGRLKVTATIN